MSVWKNPAKGWKFVAQRPWVQWGVVNGKAGQQQVTKSCNEGIITCKKGIVREPQRPGFGRNVTMGGRWQV